MGQIIYCGYTYDSDDLVHQIVHAYEVDLISLSVMMDACAFINECDGLFIDNINYNNGRAIIDVVSEIPTTPIGMTPTLSVSLTFLDSGSTALLYMFTHKLGGAHDGGPAFLPKIALYDREALYQRVVQFIKKGKAITLFTSNAWDDDEWSTKFYEKFFRPALKSEFKKR